MNIKKKFARVFVPNYNFKFSKEPLKLIADEIVYVCDTPMFDDLSDPKFIDKFEKMIALRMEDFDPACDVIAFFGDAMIFAMMAIFAMENYSEIYLARFSTKINEYVVREISVNSFSKLEDVALENHYERG